MNKTNTIFFGIITIFCTLMGFFVGSITEQNSHVTERNELLFERDSLQAKVDHYETNADYNASFNLSAKQQSTNCNKCRPVLTAIQFRLDSIEKWKGQLVVPEKYPELK